MASRAFAIGLGIAGGMLATAAVVTLSRRVAGVELDPFAPDNPVNQIIDNTVERITGDSGQTLGGVIFDGINGSFDPQTGRLHGGLAGLVDRTSLGLSDWLTRLTHGEYDPNETPAGAAQLGDFSDSSFFGP